MVATYPRCSQTIRPAPVGKSRQHASRSDGELRPVDEHEIGGVPGPDLSSVPQTDRCRRQRRELADGLLEREVLVDVLGEHAGLFMDVDSIPFGTDFRDYVRDALFDSDVLVAVVGPKWLGPGEGTHLRIKEENDPIRIEVETALNRGISVIPVLVNGGVMPKPSELPVALENFAFRNAAEVNSGRDFHPHMDRLIRSIEQILRLKGHQVSGKAVGSPATAAGEPPPAQAVPVAPNRPPEAPPAPVQPAHAAAPVGSAIVSEPAAAAPPVAKPKRGSAAIALSAVGGAAIAAVIALVAIWFYGRAGAARSSPSRR